MRTYDDRQEVGMGIADFTLMELYLNPNLSDSSTMWGNKLEGTSESANY